MFEKHGAESARYSGRNDHRYVGVYDIVLLV
jgi:hypothetical protein